MSPIRTYIGLAAELVALSLGCWLYWFAASSDTFVWLRSTQIHHIAAIAFWALWILGIVASLSGQLRNESADTDRKIAYGLSILLLVLVLSAPNDFTKV